MKEHHQEAAKSEDAEETEDAEDAALRQDANARRTFRYDLLRSTMTGVLETGFATFGLLVAIRAFDAPETWKGALVGSVSIGLLLVPWVLGLAARSGLPVTTFGALLMTLSALFAAGAALAEQTATYVFFLALSQICAAQLPALMIHVYARNYSPKERGKRLSWNIMASAFLGMGISYGFGVYLDRNWESYPWIFAGMTLVALASAATLLPIPSAPLPTSEERPVSFFSALSLVVKDKLFGGMLLGWMVMGFGVLMTLPLRVEYLAGDDGLGMTNEEVAIVTVVVFSLARIVSSRIWGMLFDHLSFIGFRLLLNLFLLSASLVYFHAATFSGTCAGAALAGIGTGGSVIAWNLWVTKLAPKGMEATYMGAHVAFTGVRGVLAPFLGYWILQAAGFQGVAWVSATLILASSLLFASFLKHPRFHNKD